MKTALELIQGELLTTEQVPDRKNQLEHQNRLAELGHPLVQKVEIPSLEGTYKALEDFGFVWKVLPSSLRKLKYVAGLCLDQRTDYLRGGREGRRHSCVQTWLGSPVVYKGDIPDAALDNIERVRLFKTEGNYYKRISHFTLHSHQPLPVKVEGLVTRLRNGVQTLLLEVDPVLVAWPEPPRIRTGSILSNNHLWTIQSDYPGIVIATWDLEKD